MKIRRLVIGLIAMLSLAGCSRAPALKTLELGDGTSIEYVEVRDEPRHRHKFENARVRLYDVLFPPGDTTLYHRHSQNTIYVVISATEMTSRTAGGEARSSMTRRGSVSFSTQLDNPVTHQVSNTGASDAHLIGVEIKDAGRIIERRPLKAPGLTVDLDRAQVRAYKIELEPGESTGPARHEFDGLLIALGPGQLRVDYEKDESVVRSFVPGQYLWGPGPLTRTFTNIGDESFEAVLYELP